MNEVHIFPPSFSKIHSNIIFPSKPRSSKWSLFRFPNQNIVRISQSFYPCYMSRPSHPPWFDYRIIFGEAYKLRSSSLCCILQHLPNPSSLLIQSILLSTLFSDTLNLRASLSVRDQVSHSYKNGSKHSSDIFCSYFLKDLLPISKLWFCPAFCCRHNHIIRFLCVYFYANLRTSL